MNRFRYRPAHALAAAAFLGCGGAYSTLPPDPPTAAASTPPTSPVPAASTSRASFKPLGARPVQSRQDVD